MASSGGTTKTKQQAPALPTTSATTSQHRAPPPLKRLGLYERSMQQKSDRAQRIKSTEAAMMATSFTFTPNTTKPNATRQQRTTPPLKRLGLYERSMQHKSDQKQRIKSIEAAMMATSCTFTPHTTKSNASRSNRTATTNASSGGTTQESVFDRLYKGSSVASSHRSPSTTTTTTTGSRRQGYSIRSSLSRSPTTTAESRTSTVMSSRIEELYEKGVRKARRRPATDQQERLIRDRLWEERELHECTFRPKLYWGSKLSLKSPPVPKQAPRSQLLSLTPPPPAKLQPRLPKEIIVSSSPPPHTTKHRPWHTPRRQEELSTSFGGTDFMMVSPLRNPSFVDDEDESSRWVTPRMIIGSTVASGASIAMTQSDETEYGSI